MKNGNVKLIAVGKCSNGKIEMKFYCEYCGAACKFEKNVLDASEYIYQCHNCGKKSLIVLKPNTDS